MTIASSKLKPSHGMNATSRFAPSASSPPSVDEPSAMTSPRFTLSPRMTAGFWWMSVPWFERMNFVSGYSSRVPRPSTTMRSASTSTTVPSFCSEDDVAGVHGSPELEPRADDRRLRDHERHRLLLHVRAHERAVRVVVLEERDERRRDRDDLRRGDVHVLDVLRLDDHGLALARPAEHLLVQEPSRLRIDRLGGLGDRELALLGRVEVDDLVRHLAALDDAVRRLDEAELRDGRERGERADEADVRSLRRLDRAHAPVVRRVHVAHLDRCALAGQAARAERGETPAVREPGQRVRLVHELRQLRRAEELLQRGDDRADVDDRLRSDRVDVLGRHPLADDALHAVETDAERLLDQLARRAEAAVAEVLVLVELARGSGRARAWPPRSRSPSRPRAHRGARAGRRACGRARRCPRS